MYSTSISKHLYWITVTLLINFALQPMYATTWMSFPFYEGPLEELQKSAVYNNKPVVVYFYENDCRLCKDLDKGTWSNPSLIDYARYNILASRKNLYTYEGNILARQYNIDQPGTILIFSPTGNIVERITFAIHAGQLLQRLEYTYEKYQPQTFTGAQAGNIYSSSVITRSKDPEIVSKTRYHEVPEYYYRSPEAFSKLTYREAYTVVYQRVNKLRKIKRKIRKIRKRWPNKIWVMAEEQPGKNKQYVIALGKFDDLEEAKYFAMIFTSWNQQPKEPLKLNGIFD